MLAFVRLTYIFSCQDTVQSSYFDSSHLTTACWWLRRALYDHRLVVVIPLFPDGELLRGSHAHMLYCKEVHLGYELENMKPSKAQKK